MKTFASDDGSKVSFDFKAPDSTLLQTIMLNPKIKTGSECGSVKELLTNAAKLGKAFGGYVIVTNDEAPDVLDSVTGVTSGGYIYVTSKYVGLFYVPGATQFTVYKAPNAEMRCHFVELTPLSYYATYSARLVGECPISYSTLGDRCFSIYRDHSTSSLPGFPVCSKAVAEGTTILGAWGIKGGSIGVEYVGQTKAAGAQRILCAKTVKPKAFSTEGGIVLTSALRKRATSFVNSLINGGKLDPSFSVEFEVPKSEAYTKSGKLYFIKGATQEVVAGLNDGDSVVFIRPSANVTTGTGIREYINTGDVQYVTGVIAYGSDIEAILKEYETKYVEIKANNYKALFEAYYNTYSIVASATTRKPITLLIPDGFTQDDWCNIHGMSGFYAQNITEVSSAGFNPQKVERKFEGVNAFLSEFNAVKHDSVKANKVIEKYAANIKADLLNFSDVLRVDDGIVTFNENDKVARDAEISRYLLTGTLKSIDNYVRQLADESVSSGDSGSHHEHWGHRCHSHSDTRQLFSIEGEQKAEPEMIKDFVFADYCVATEDDRIFTHPVGSAVPARQKYTYVDNLSISRIDTSAGTVDGSFLFYCRPLPSYPARKGWSYLQQGVKNWMRHVFTPEAGFTVQFAGMINWFTNSFNFVHDCVAGHGFGRYYALRYENHHQVCPQMAFVVKFKNMAITDFDKSKCTYHSDIARFDELEGQITSAFAEADSKAKKAAIEWLIDKLEKLGLLGDMVVVGKVDYSVTSLADLYSLSDFTVTGIESLKSLISALIKVRDQKVIEDGVKADYALTPDQKARVQQNINKLLDTAGYVSEAEFASGKTPEVVLSKTPLWYQSADTLVGLKGKYNADLLGLYCLL